MKDKEEEKEPWGKTKWIEIREYISSQARAELRKELIAEIEGMKKEVCGCEKDEHPQAPGYHTKECDLEPYGYNQAIQDFINLITHKEE